LGSFVGTDDSSDGEKRERTLTGRRGLVLSCSLSWEYTRIPQP
jgi:hypothetical protein